MCVYTQEIRVKRRKGGGGGCKLKAVNSDVYVN